MATFAGVENFESYANNDDLDGKTGGTGWAAGWTKKSTGTTVVSNTTAYTGSLSVRVTGEVAQVAWADRTFIAAADGSINVAFRVPAFSAVAGGFIELFSDATEAVYALIYTGAGGDGVYLYINGAYTLVGTTLSVDTWYVLNIEWDNGAQANKARARVYQSAAWSAFTSWGTAGASFSSLNTLRLRAPQTIYQAQVYYDDIYPTAAVATGNPKNLLLLGVG